VEERGWAYRRRQPEGTVLYEAGRWLGSVVRGYFAYHAVPTNSRIMGRFRAEVIRTWAKSLRRRSQRHRLSWQRVTRLANRWLPPARIQHPWPDERFYVQDPRWEPSAVAPLARICAGAARAYGRRAVPTATASGTECLRATRDGERAERVLDTCSSCPPCLRSGTFRAPNKSLRVTKLELQRDPSDTTMVVSRRGRRLSRNGGNRIGAHSHLTFVRRFYPTPGWVVAVLERRCFAYVRNR
jgi:hypothetical protein